MRVIVHVGAHKTGTTALQDFLLGRFSRLENPTPWFPPPRSHGPGHALIAWNTYGDPRGDQTEALADVVNAARAQGVENLLLSSEEFSVLKQPGVEYFHGLESDDLHFVCVMTSFRRRYLSWWNEIVKHGHADPYEASADALLNLLGEHDNFLRRLSVSAPHAKFHVIIHDHQDGPTASVRNFLKVLEAISGCPCDGDDFELAATNVSMPPAAIELMRLANTILDENGLAAHDDYVRSILELLCRKADAAGLLQPMTLSLPEAILERLDATRALFLRAIDNLAVQGRVTVYGTLGLL